MHRVAGNYHRAAREARPGQQTAANAVQQQPHGLALGFFAVGVGRGAEAANHVAEFEHGVGIIGVEVHRHGDRNIVANFLAHAAQQVFFAAANALHLHGPVQIQPHAVQSAGRQGIHNAVGQAQVIFARHGPSGQSVGVQRGDNFGPGRFQHVDYVYLFKHIPAVGAVEIRLQGGNGAERIAFALQRTNGDFHAITSCCAS